MARAANSPSAGHPEPKFIVKLGGRYYVTVSVLEYDPNAAGATEAQKQGAAQIAATFENAPNKLQAVQVQTPHVAAHIQTGGK
jgi:hypothetical protein